MVSKPLNMYNSQFQTKTTNFYLPEFSSNEQLIHTYQNYKKKQN